MTIKVKDLAGNTIGNLDANNYVRTEFGEIVGSVKGYNPPTQTIQPKNTLDRPIVIPGPNVT